MRTSKLTHFKPNVAFHIEISHLIFRANQMTGFYMKCNSKIKWVNQVFDINCHLSFPLYQLVDLQISVWVNTHRL